MIIIIIIIIYNSSKTYYFSVKHFLKIKNKKYE